MNISINGLALQFLLPTALMIPLFAWAGYRIAADKKRRRLMVGLMVLMLLIGSLWNLALDFGLAFSPGHQDVTYYNDFYSAQITLTPALAICAALLAYWAQRNALYGGAGLVALGMAVPALWWGASRTSNVLGSSVGGLILVVAAILGALVGALATLVPEHPAVDRVRQFFLWIVAAATGAVGGVLFGSRAAGSPWEPPRVAADPALPTLLLITILIIVLSITALIPAVIMAALSGHKFVRLVPIAVGVILAMSACWVALADLPALNQSAVSAPLQVNAPRMLTLPEGPPPRPSVDALAFSPNGQWLAVGQSPESIHPEYQGGMVIWSTSDWHVIANIQPSTGAMWPLWSPDSRQLIVVTGNGEVRVLTTQDWKVVRSWSRPGTLAGGAIAPDGHTLWLAESSALTAWAVQDGTPASRIPLDEKPSSPPVIAPSSGWIGVGEGAIVNVWHLPEGTPWQQLPGHINHAIHLSASPDSTSLSVGSWDAVARIWRIEDGVLLGSIPDAGENIAYSPDGTYLAGASIWGVSAIYQAGAGERRMVLGRAGISGLDKVTALAYSPDGKWLVGAGQTLNMALWTLPALRALPSAATAGPPTITAAPVGSLQPLTADTAQNMAQVGVMYQDALSAVFLPLSNTLALAGGEIRLFPAPLPGTRAARGWATDDNGYLLAASPDGRLLATRGQTTNELDVWRSAEGTRAAHLTGPSDNLLTAAFSPDSKLLAAAGEEGIVFTWALDGGSPAQRWPAGIARVRSLIFSRDGSTIWVGGDDTGGVRLVHVADGTLVRALDANKWGVAAVALSPDGQTLAVATNSYDVQLWRTEDGTQLSSLSEAGGELKTLAWSPDGALLAGGGWGKNVTVWETSSGKILVALTGHTEGISTVLFAPDSRLLISVASDSTVRLWGVYGP